MGNQAEEPREGITDDQLAELTGLDNLEELEILHSPITDAGLRHLARLKGLKQLMLWVCLELEGSDLASIADLKSLRELELMDPVSANGLASIAGLNGLEKLDLNIADLEPADVLPLAHLRHLHTLSLTIRDANDDPVQVDDQFIHDQLPLGNAIARAWQIAGLEDSPLKAPVSNQGAGRPRRAGKLQAVRLLLDEVNDDSLELASGLPRLRQLRLRGTSKLSDEAVAPLARLTALVDLTLPAENLTDAGLAHLAPLTRLEYLNLPGSKITGTGLSAFQCKSLRQLNLSGSLFNDAGCRNLRQFPALKRSACSRRSLPTRDSNQSPSFPNLEKLYVYDTAITDAGAVKLGPLKKLREVYAMGTTVSQRAVDTLHATGSSVWVIFDPAPRGDDEDENVYFPAE